MREFILLFVNGQEHRVSGTDAFLTLSDFLRKRLCLCGTKIVCSEGDCGSCSTLCGRLNEDGDAFEYLSIDSCIRFVFQLDCCHIITVEGLADGDNLHPVQAAMVKCHGSQCGFCTPGFVMSMAGILEQSECTDRRRLALRSDRKSVSLHGLLTDSRSRQPTKGLLGTEFERAVSGKRNDSSNREKRHAMACESNLKQRPCAAPVH